MSVTGKSLREDIGCIVVRVDRGDQNGVVRDELLDVMVLDVDVFGAIMMFWILSYVFRTF